MEDFRRTYLRACKDVGVDPQECVLAQLLQERPGSAGARLDLSGQSLSADSCLALGRAFQDDTAFTEVSLSDCMLSEEGAKGLLTGFFTNTTVKVLDLKGNNLRSTGAEILGKLVARNKTIRRLVLEWNALGMWDEAFSLFCQGLSANATVAQLDLRNNQISHQGASELATVLRRNGSLEVLDLRWNNVGLLGGRSLLEALQQNHTLMQLEMAGNNVPKQTTGHNSDKRSLLTESRSRTKVLSKEINILKQEKGRQYLSLMETIDRQRDEMGRSSRSTSVHVGQLQEALNERKSTINALTAKRSRRRGRRWPASDGVLREGKLLRDLQNGTESNTQLRNKQQIFELKQELTNTTAELKLRLVQAEDRLEMEKRRSKQALEDMDALRQKEVEHVNRHLEESERALQDRIFKLENQRIHLEEELSRSKAVCVTQRAEADEELGTVRAQVRLEEQEQVTSLEEKLRGVRQSRQEAQSHCTQQKQTIAQLQAQQGQHRLENDGLRRRVEDLQQELSGKDQERVAEVSLVRVELQEQVGHLQVERTAQAGLKEKISALEREMKALSSSHREALLDRESECGSLLERVRLRDAEIQRMREDEAQRASYLQGAVLAYVQGSPLLGPYGSPKK
ncbi:hypothetical protein NHX12_024644 [Muraenolepis orangiensis]|uniref:Leucine rich repeat containing 45 n=1 Tax=Muraenolepis orangiensis TaxID=630683 RepID=A0A9Q0ELF6_9TELE|nr:hypothetical protein NHX12_024644 [Muraenolepis orangiensis]